MSATATLLVCVTCKSEAGPMGPGLFEALGERLAAEPDIALKAVECLSVCKRPARLRSLRPANGLTSSAT